MFGFSFDMFSVMFSITFFIVIAVFAVTAVKGIRQWNRNNHSPRLTVEAEIVAKRADVSHHHHCDAGSHAGFSSSSTTYYVTFEVESGDRIELRVQDSDYGLLVEGDVGRLTFQGTRYLGFERSI